MAESGWGAEEMSALEAIMWRGESEDLRSTIVSLEILETTPSWQDFWCLHEDLVNEIPRLRERVVEAPLGLAPPRWSADNQFDLSHHVRHEQLAGTAALADVFDRAATIACEEFDRARPPWTATLLELDDGRSAYVLKLHHSTSDGKGIIQLLTRLHTGRAVPEDDVASSRRRAEDPPRTTQLTSWGLIGGEAVKLARGIPGLAGHTARVAAHAVGSPRDTAAYARSLRRVLTPPPAAPSPLLASRSRNWRFAGIDVDRAALRAAGKRAGGTINDAYLAALTGGYRRLHEAEGVPVDSLPITIPISIRGARDGGGGNKFASARMAAPVGVADPGARIKLIGAMVRAARDEPALDNLNVIAPILARLPGPAINSVVGGMTRSNDLQASNVPGSDVPLVLAGARVQSMYPFAPLPGCPAMVTLLSYAETCFVGINYDAASFRDPDLFLDCLAAGFNEVLALSDSDVRARRAR